MSLIKSVQAFEILDSRGNPTLQASVYLNNGIVGTSSVPSGVSTGTFEAVELRDNDMRRYDGKGVLKAVEHINRILAPALVGRNPIHHQAELDHLMINLDGSENKSILGANAIIGVSQAIACAAAKALDIPLYVYLGKKNGTTKLPMPMINIINGGKHADNNLGFQEFMIVPIGAPTFAECLRYSIKTFYCLKQILHAKGYSTNVGDEGGFAPRLDSNEDALSLIVQAIDKAHFEPGKDLAIALDPAASSFYKNGKYYLSSTENDGKSSTGLNELYKLYIEKYPIVSIEDGLDENDWDGFKTQTALLGDKIQIVGDDILVTNPKFINRAIEEKTCNAALIKLNQIGTVTETIEAIELCNKAQWGYVISHRSGETNDAFIADFSVAMGGGQIKTGSVCRGERIAKYNRLLEIERELGDKAVFENPFI